MQCILDDVLRGESQPLRHRDISKPRRLQYLEKNDFLGTRILNVVRS